MNKTSLPSGLEETAKLAPGHETSSTKERVMIKKMRTTLAALTAALTLAGCSPGYQACVAWCNKVAESEGHSADECLYDSCAHLSDEEGCSQAQTDLHECLTALECSEKGCKEEFEQVQVACNGDPTQAAVTLKE